MKRVAIIGGGPIGVEAALYGACAGFDVQLYERGQIAANVRRWGHIGFFTEWGRNRSPLACKLLRAQGVELAPDDTTSTGHELADYVERLAGLEPLRGRLHLNTEVLSLTRERCLKSDFIADPRRTDFPFRLLLRDASGERVAHADAVLDATGVYATPNWLGSGGAPCAGEISCRPYIDYHLPDVAGGDRERFANHHTLVIGSGHSAAQTLIAICDLMEKYPQTRVTWIVRRDVPPHGYPYTLVEDDPSPNRDRLHRRANELIEHPQVRFWPRAVTTAVERSGQRFRVTIDRLHDDGEDCEVIECDNIVAHTGFRPDHTLWRELQVQVHPATDGPYRLAEILIANNARGGVGLSTGYAEKRPAPSENTSEEPMPDRWHINISDPALLLSGEPNFFIIGIKSYGRDAGFLMHNGFRQVRDVYKLVSGDPTLDLYEGVLDE